MAASAGTSPRQPWWSRAAWLRLLLLRVRPCAVCRAASGDTTGSALLELAFWIWMSIEYLQVTIRPQVKENSRGPTMGSKTHLSYSRRWGLRSIPGLSGERASRAVLTIWDPGRPDQRGQVWGRTRLVALKEARYTREELWIFIRALPDQISVWELIFSPLGREDGGTKGSIRIVWRQSGLRL